MNSSKTQQSRSINNNSINSLISHSTVNTNSIQSNQSNINIKPTLQTIPITQINLFNQSTKKEKPNHSLINTTNKTTKDKKEPFRVIDQMSPKNKINKIFQQDSFSSIEVIVHNNNSVLNNKSKRRVNEINKKTLQTIQTHKRGNSITSKLKVNNTSNDNLNHIQNSKKNNCKSLSYKSENKNSCSNIKPLKVKHIPLIKGNVNRKEYLNTESNIRQKHNEASPKNVIKNTNKKLYFKSFLDLTLEDENNNNGNHNLINDSKHKAIQTSSGVIHKAINKNYKTINPNSNINHNKLNSFNMKSIIQNNSNKNIQHNSKVLPKKINLNKDKIKTLDYNDNNYINKKLSFILDKSFSESDKQFQSRMNKFDKINDINITSLLYFITTFDNSLTTQFQTYINKLANEYNSTGQNKYLDILNCNRAQKELFVEMKSLFNNIKERNDKIKLFKETKKYLSNDKTKINEEHEQRMKNIKLCFEKCHKNFNILSLLIQKTNKDIQILRKELYEKEKKKNAQKLKTNKINKGNDIDQIKNKQKRELRRKRTKLKYKKISTCCLNKNKSKTKTTPTKTENDDYCNADIDDDIGESQFIESKNPNKQLIMLPKANEFNVQKPKEQNLNYKPYESHSDIFLSDNDENDVNVTSISKVVIGEIEAYKDIIEEDKLNNFKHQRSKSSFHLHNKIINKKDLFKNIRILEDESQISDLENEDELFNMDMSSNIDEDEDEDEYIKELDDEFEIEEDFEVDEEWGEITKRTNKQCKLPYHISKISFSKVFDETVGEFKITEDIQSHIMIPMKKRKSSKKNNKNVKQSKTKLKSLASRLKLKKLKSRTKKHFDKIKETDHKDNKSTFKKDIIQNLEIQSSNECVIF